MAYEQRDNSGSVWATKNYSDDSAKCHFSGDAMVGGVSFKLFGRRYEETRLIDFTVNGQNVAKCEMERCQQSNSEKAPNYMGSVILNETEYEVAGWAKLVKTQNGEKRMLSLAFKAVRATESSRDSDLDEETPF